MSDRARDEDLLRTIAESISRLSQYTVVRENDFLHEPIMQDAVLRRLETLADAARHLSRELTSSTLHPRPGH